MLPDKSQFYPVRTKDSLLVEPSWSCILMASLALFSIDFSNKAVTLALTLKKSNQIKKTDVGVLVFTVA